MEVHPERAVAVDRAVKRPWLGAAVQVPLSAWAQTPYPKRPRRAALAVRQAMLVDDGTCPAGEIKEITGDSREKAIARTVRW